MQRVVGKALVGKATIEMTMLRVNGLKDTHLGSKLVKRLPSAVTGRFEFENAIRVRRAVWGSKAAMGKEYPALGPVARRLLSLHATSAAPEKENGLNGARCTARTEVAWLLPGPRS